MKRITFLFTFLLTMVGGTRVWADAYSTGFETADGWAGTNSLSSVADGWAVWNGTSSTVSSSYYYLNTQKSAGTYSMYAMGNSTDYLITPKLAAGTISWKQEKRNASSTVSIIIYKASKNNDGTFTIATTALYSDTQKAFESSFSSKSCSLDEDSYIAILLCRACMDEFSASNGLASDDAGAIAKPTNFAVTGTTYNSATFSWTAGGSETAWQIVYGAPGFDKDAATPVDVTTNPYTTPTNLTENTAYEAYLRAKSGNDVSSWTSKVTFTTPAQYPAPTGFACTGFTATTATFGWTNGSTESAWEIKYDTNENFDPASEGISQPVSENPYTLSGLTAETTYYAYIRANYGSNNYSAWSEKITFTPSATTIITLYNEGSTNNNIPVYGLYSDYGTNSQFILPSGDLNDISGRNITKIQFYTSSNWSDSPKYEIYMLEVNDATFTSASFVDWTTMTKVKNETTLTCNDKILEIVLDDAFEYGGSNLLIGFKETGYGSGSSVSWYGKNMSSGQYTAAYNTANGSHVYGSVNRSTFLPKITISSIPGAVVAVKKPKNLECSSVIATAATLGWTDGEEGLSAWQVSYATSESFDPDMDGTIVDANANPFSVSNLTPETTYYAYVRAKKGSDVSDWSNIVSFTTPNAKPSNIAVNTTDNSATFSWTANAGESAWQMVYSTNPDFNKDEATPQAVSTNPYTLNGLTTETTYYAYLRADLGNGNYSGWTDKISFTPSFNHELTVNDDSDENSYVPFWGSYTDAANRGESQFIIPASQITTMNGATINQMTFYIKNAISSWASGSAPTFEVYLKEVNNTEFATAAFVDWGTKVWEGQISFDGTELILDLDSPFTYNGGNLMVGFKEPAGAGYNTSIVWLGKNTTTNCAVQNKSGSTSYAYTKFLPKTTFSWETLTGPRLEVSEDAIDFGEITMSSTEQDKQKTFTISNTGVQELTGLSVSCSGTGFSVSDLPRKNITTSGENANDIELTVTFAPTTSGAYNGAITISATNQPNKEIALSANYVAAPVMAVYNDEQGNEAATTGQTVDFGYAQATPTYTYYIKNTGAGTLDVTVNNGGLTVSPVSASLVAGAQQAFTITAIAETNATVTFTGKDNSDNSEVGTFTVTLQGEVMPLTGKFFEGFNYADGNATTTELDGWEVNNSDKNVMYYNGYVYYWASGDESGSVVTPRLYVSGTSDVLRLSAYLRNATYNNTLLKISYSADKSSWVDAASYDKNSLTTETQALEVSNIPEGSYYFKIEMSDVAVDYFYGFSSSVPAMETLAQTSAPSFTTGIKDVTLSRTYVDGWNTICLPFAVSDITGKFGAEAKAYAYTGNDNGQLTFTKVDAMDAGTPYLLNIPDVASLGDLVFYNASIASTDAGSVDWSNVSFQGTYAPIANQANGGNLTGKYVLTTEGKVAKAGSGATMKGYRAYFNNASGARLSLFVEEDGTTTAIGTIENGEVKMEGVYNLQGQKVQNLKKGLYIMNGKKVVRK